MTQENPHERKEKRRLTVVVIPGVETAKTRTISVSRIGLVLSLITAFFVIVAFAIALVAYTPARALLPVSSPEIERRYGKQIAEVQRQVGVVIQEMERLRAYNLRLRKALGDPISAGESLSVMERESVAARMSDVVADQRSRDITAVQNASHPESIPFVGTESSTPIRIVSDREDETNLRLELPLTMPADGYFTRGFDASRYHYGVDIAGRPGSAILAAADGDVMFSGWTFDDGYTLMIAHEGGMMTVYKHNQALLKTAGAVVKRGEPVALLGNTGITSSGPHLHLEVWKDGRAQDPQRYLLTML